MCVCVRGTLVEIIMLIFCTTKPLYCIIIRTTENFNTKRISQNEKCSDVYVVMVGCDGSVNGVVHVCKGCWVHILKVSCWSVYFFLGVFTIDLINLSDCMYVYTDCANSLSHAWVMNMKLSCVLFT